MLQIIHQANDNTHVADVLRVKICEEYAITLYLLNSITSRYNTLVNSNSVEKCFMMGN